MACLSSGSSEGNNHSNNSGPGQTNNRTQKCKATTCQGKALTCDVEKVANADFVMNTLAFNFIFLFATL